MIPKSVNRFSDKNMLKQKVWSGIMVQPENITL